VLLPSDTHRKPITSITAVLLPIVTYLLTLPHILINEGFKVLTAVVRMSSNFWATTACNSLKFNQHFGRIMSRPSSV
jgi:hypothetical protein